MMMMMMSKSQFPLRSPVADLLAAGLRQVCSRLVYVYMLC